MNYSDKRVSVFLFFFCKSFVNLVEINIFVQTWIIRITKDAYRKKNISSNIEFSYWKSC